MSHLGAITSTANALILFNFNDHTMKRSHTPIDTKIEVLFN